MALTTMVVQKCASPGEALEAAASPIVAAAGKVYAATSDFEFANDGKTLLIVDNQQAAATTAIGFTFPTKSFGGAPYAQAASVGHTVTAATIAVFGPFPTSLNNAAGKIVGTIGTLTTTFITAVSLG